MKSINKQPVTQEQVKELLNYDPETGVFTWKVNRTGTVRAGDIAGKITKEGYIRIGLMGYHIMAHRLAWFYVYGVWPDDEVDHRNEVKSDNRIDNLRDASHSANMHNRQRKAGASGAAGVYWLKAKAMWASAISVDGRRRFLGTFPTVGEASRAYKAAKKTLRVAA